MRNVIEKVSMKSLRKLYQEDFNNIKFGVSERNICARLAHHMENVLREWDDPYYRSLFDKYYVDVEYNRMGNGDLKHYENSERRPQYMVSDLLIQRRAYGGNLLAVEMKRKGNKKNVDKDKVRLASLVSPSNNESRSDCVYDTQLGAFLVYSLEGVNVELFYYSHEQSCIMEEQRFTIWNSYTGKLIVEEFKGNDIII